MLNKSTEPKIATATTTRVTTTTATAAKTPKSIIKILPHSKTSLPNNIKTIPLLKKSPSLNTTKPISANAKAIQTTNRMALPASVITMNSMTNDLSFPLLTVTVQNDRSRFITTTTGPEKSTDKRSPIEQNVKPSDLSLTKKVLLKNTSLKYISSENQRARTTETNINANMRSESPIDLLKSNRCDESNDTNSKSLFIHEDQLLLRNETIDSTENIPNRLASLDLIDKSESEKIDLLNSSEREYNEHR